MSATVKAHHNCKVNGENWIASLPATQKSTEMALRSEERLLNCYRYPQGSNYTVSFLFSHLLKLQNT